jgi:SAM-dependent methyltransferase
MKLEEGVYDVVLCDNVFEHLQKPMFVLEKLARSLRPGGVIDLRTLSAESLSLWAQPHEWSYFARGHTFLPTLVSLRHYFDACGLRAVSLRTRGFRSGVRGKYGKPGVFRRAIDNVIRPAACSLKLGHRVEVVLEKITR